MSVATLVLVPVELFLVSLGQFVVNLVLVENRFALSGASNFLHCVRVIRPGYYSFWLPAFSSAARNYERSVFSLVSLGLDLRSFG